MCDAGAIDVVRQLMDELGRTREEITVLIDRLEAKAQARGIKDDYALICRGCGDWYFQKAEGGYCPCGGDRPGRVRMQPIALNN